MKEQLMQYWPMLVTLVIIPLLVPLLKDVVTNLYIVCMNKMKDKPTWAVGVNLISISIGTFIMRDCQIYKVDFSSVYIRRRYGNYFDAHMVVKKRDMQTAVIVYPHIAEPVDVSTGE